ncbi:MAG TPA: lamin tail domain-containing protein, partial [Pyrinomonadaceae bacterium]|nr:lamin tail domain-containing protein [Pyrinomonadaceae bacterium]
MRRVTYTSGEVVNLNPSMSGDGRQIAFESSADLAQTGGGQSFRALRASLDTEPSTFSELGRTRIVSPGLSHDGSKIVFSSLEDLVGQNGDRNPEIFLQRGTELRQTTQTAPGLISTRLTDGNFQPSITDDGRWLAFSSNRDLVGLNGDLNFEVFICEAETQKVIQLTDSIGTVGATDARISGDGSHLVFINNQGTVSGPEQDLVLYTSSTRAAQTIVATAPALALTYGTAISDNGARIVFSLNPSQDQSEVFLFDAAIGTYRQVTKLGSRVSDVPLNPTISGDGKRIAFATRRRVTATSDGSVDLYVYDLPTAQFIQLTNAPASATAEVVSSFNDDGSLVAFNFPRVLSEVTSSNEAANNCEIFVAFVPPRPAFAPLSVLNAASMGNEPGPLATMPRGGIILGKGNALASFSLHANATNTGSFPLALAGTSVTVNGLQAEILYVSPTEVTIVVPNGVSSGLAEIAVSNAEGFQSRASVLISNAAPGIFTTSGDGRGLGVILDADKLISGPFDPTSGQLRLSIFATGVRHAIDVSSSIAGQAVNVEAVMPSPNVPGLDEIHLLVPADLRGSGEVNLTIVADGLESNNVILTLGGSPVRDIVINEILADPPDGLAGDANHDGTRSASADEFVELINSTTRDLDLSGYQLQTRSLSGTADIVRHRFPVGTIFPAGTALIVFGGGNIDSADPIFAGAKVFEASTGGISLSNSGGTITVRDASGSVVTSAQFGTAPGVAADDNQSLTRFPDITGGFVLHKLAAGNSQSPFSAGTRVNGAPFSPLPLVARVEISPTSANLFLGQELQFEATAFGKNNEELNDVLFTWESSDASVATIDQTGLTLGMSTGTAGIVATARGVRSAPAVMVVMQPSPSPSPTPLPSPSPTPSVTPSPSPSPSASPSPSPPQRGRVVISQVYGGGGNSGALFKNDFIEIFNSGNIEVDLTGWSIQYASATSSTWSVTNLTSVSLLPGQYYLIQEASGGANGQSLPVP